MIWLTGLVCCAQSRLYSLSGFSGMLVNMVLLRILISLLGETMMLRFGAFSLPVFAHALLNCLRSLSSTQLMVKLSCTAWC